MSMSSPSRWAALVVALAACSEPPSATMPAQPLAGAGEAPSQAAPSVTGGSPATGSAAPAVSAAGAAAAPSAGTRAAAVAGAGAAMASGASDAAVGAAADAAMPAAGATAAVTPDAGAGITDAATDAMLPDATAATDLMSYAKALDGLFLDAPCDKATPTPLAEMATCDHPAGTQRVEKPLVFGGDPTKTYEVKLRVRGIWEPTKIQGGKKPVEKQPFTIGGSVPTGMNSGDPINYQQYSIEVAMPKQTYWLNDHQYVAHDIHKDDYEATVQIAGGSAVTVRMNDGNEREIANWTKDYFEGLPPYDKMPSLGQSLSLSVLSVTAP